MIEQLFSILVKLAGVYILTGLVVAVLFFRRWSKAMDPSAVGGSRGFKALVTPGVIALWPMIVMKVFHQRCVGNADGAEALRRNHRIAIVLLAVVGVLLFTTAFVWRAPAFTGLPAIESPVP